MQSSAFDKSQSIPSLFSKSEVSGPNAPIPPIAPPITQNTQDQSTQSTINSNSNSIPLSDQSASSAKQSVNGNSIIQDNMAKLDTPPVEGSISNLPKTKLIALFIAPTLVLILILIAVWTLYRKGVLTGCIKRTKKESHARSNLLQEQMRNDTSLNSILSPYYGFKLKSQHSDSIPELSEWLESVHGSDEDEEKSIPFPNRQVSPSILPSISSDNGPRKSSSVTEPKPVLSTSSETTKSIINQKHSILTTGSFGASYQNTHILRPQEGNIWKLGALKYSKKRSNPLITPSPSEEKVGFMRSLWQVPKTLSGGSMENENTKSWWSKKSVSVKQDTNIDLDNFHVW